ncbi:MAG: hypothetical protein ACK5MV_11260 [Aminipila sp.]
MVKVVKMTLRQIVISKGNPCGCPLSILTALMQVSITEKLVCVNIYKNKKTTGLYNPVVRL